jgi:hypothetical protein
MKSIFQKHYPLIIGLFFLYLLYFSLFAVSYLQNEEHMVYSLDDAYIHMAMAKNLAIDGVWGVSKYEFTSSSSSILWTSLLALFYYLFGVNEITPLILNLIFASLVIISSYFILIKHSIKKSFIFLILLSLVVVTPLPPLMFTGLEHVFHIWVSLLFMYLVSENLVEKKSDRKILIWILILAAVLPAIRYEGIFLVMVASALFFLKKKYTTGIITFVFSVIPIIIFGLVSVRNGWSFFPNSLLLKAGFPDITSFSDLVSFSGALMEIFVPGRYLVPAVLCFVIFAISFYFFTKSRYNYIFNLKITYLLLLFIANLILYAAYSKSGWTYRYQSFLVALGIIVFSVLFFEYFLKGFGKNSVFRSGFVILAVSVPFFYFLVSGIALNIQTPVASANIYEQQYQMGQFLRKYYEGEGVALNDIGTSNYFADIKCLDLWGLANIEVSKKRRSGKFNSDDISSICVKYDIKIAIVYDSWFLETEGSIIPGEWIKTGTWQIMNNVIAGDDTVSFYAVNVKEAEILQKYLKEFSSELPVSAVSVDIF